METSEPYEIPDAEVQLNSAALFDDKANSSHVKGMKSADTICKNIDALWASLSGNKKASLIEHTHLGKIIANGINKAGNSFYPSLDKSTFNTSQIKNYVNLILKEGKQGLYKDALDNKKPMVINKDDLDVRVLNLTEESICKMKKPTVYKLRNMKALNDEEFASVLSGDDTPYAKVDKNRIKKEELLRVKNDLSKEHKISVKLIDIYLKSVRDNQLLYVEKVLEIEALEKKLERTERVSINLMKKQLKEEINLRIVEGVQVVDGYGLNPIPQTGNLYHRTKKVTETDNASSLVLSD